MYHDMFAYKKVSVSCWVIEKVAIKHLMFMNKKKSYVTIIHLENHRYLP